MSGKKISELQELLALENDDLLLVVDADEANVANKSKSVKISTLKAEVGSAADATTSSKGIIQLAGDLSGTADAPTVPGLANKYDASNPAGFVDASGAAAAAPVQQEDLEALDDRLIPIEGIFEFQHNVAYQNNAGIYANGQPGVEDALLRSGWYYENLVSGQKINWYFFDGNPLSPTFMADIEVQNFAAYAVVTFDSIASRPFLSVYTLPTGTNDIIPGFAHSSFAYSQYPITPDIGRKYLIHIGEAPAIHPELPRIQLGLSVGLGDQAPTEKVLTAALSSDSGASVGNVKFVAEHVGVNAPNLKANAELKIAKQNLLVSGTNIKTVNGSTLLGSGDLVVGGGVAEATVTNVFNDLGSTTVKGTVVYLNGRQGDRPKIAKSLANSEMSSTKTFGLVYNDILDMADGQVITTGLLSGLNTDVVGWTEGSSLWLSSTVAGEYTNVKPSAPNHAVFIGTLVRKHPTQGSIQVKIQNGYELEELHNVSIPVTPANGDVLAYELSTSLWKNKALTAADVGLGNVTNTSDENKPISTATQTALDTLASKLDDRFIRGFKFTRTSATQFSIGPGVCIAEDGITRMSLIGSGSSGYFAVNNPSAWKDGVIITGISALRVFLVKRTDQTQYVRYVPESLTLTHNDIVNDPTDVKRYIGSIPMYTNNTIYEFIQTGTENNRVINFGYNKELATGVTVDTDISSSVGGYLQFPHTSTILNLQLQRTSPNASIPLDTNIATVSFQCTLNQHDGASHYPMAVYQQTLIRPALASGTATLSVTSLTQRLPVMYFYNPKLVETSGVLFKLSSIINGGFTVTCSGYVENL